MINKTVDTYTKADIERMLLSGQNFFYLPGLGPVKWSTLKTLFDKMGGNESDYIAIQEGTARTYELKIAGGF